jgi:hypothetical protein
MAEGNNSLAIQAARRIARDETFGNSALLREANMAELMRRAKEESDKLIEEKNRAVGARKVFCAKRSKKIDLTLMNRK